MTDADLVTALADGYRHVVLTRDRDALPARLRDLVPAGCALLEAVARRRHPTLGAVWVRTPVPIALLDDSDYDLAIEIRPVLDEAVALIIERGRG